MANFFTELGIFTSTMVHISLISNLLLLMFLCVEEWDKEFSARKSEVIKCEFMKATSGFVALFP